MICVYISERPSKKDQDGTRHQKYYLSRHKSRMGILSDSLFLSWTTRREVRVRDACNAPIRDFDVYLIRAILLRGPIGRSADIWPAAWAKSRVDTPNSRPNIEPSKKSVHGISRYLFVFARHWLRRSWLTSWWPWWVMKWTGECSDWELRVRRWGWAEQRKVSWRDCSWELCGWFQISARAGKNK